MLDADIAIYAVGGRRDVLNAISALAPDELSMSAVVHSQLVQGSLTSEQRLRIRKLTSAAAVLPYDLAASMAYGAIIERLSFSRPRQFDRMIAAHAISLGAALATNNPADFADIPELRIERWT
jgi:tRNA(fMet)-specific endonuclease VapC